MITGRLQPPKQPYSDVSSPRAYSEYREKVSALLERYRSGETYRAARNTSVLAASLIAMRLLKLNLNDVSLFGLKIDAAYLHTGSILISILLAFFVATLWIYTIRDNRIQSDRRNIAIGIVDEAEQHIVALDKRTGEGVDSAHVSQKWRLLIENYKAHLKRTVLARTLDRFAAWVECGVPTLLALGAIICLW